MKRLNLFFLFLLICIFVWGQKPANYGDEMIDSNCRRIESHKISLYENIYHEKGGYAYCTLVHVFEGDKSVWAFCVNLCEGRINIAPKSSLYFGYPNKDNLLETVVKMTTDNGTGKLVRDDECLVYYNTSEEDIIKLFSSDRVEQVLVYCTTGNIGEFVKKKFQEKLKKEYEFIKNTKLNKCKNKYLYRGYLR